MDKIKIHLNKNQEFDYNGYHYHIWWQDIYTTIDNCWAINISTGKHDGISFKISPDPEDRFICNQLLELFNIEIIFYEKVVKRIKKTEEIESEVVEWREV